jgi:general secretion pathway protein E
MSTVKQTRTIARELPTGGVAPPRFTPNHKLVLAQVVAALIEDGLLGTADGDRILLDARSGQGRLDLHPLVVIANLKPKDGRDASKTLTLESLTEWLAEQAELPYFKIDPMKIKMAEVTEVIGQAYAQRYRILPVAVTAEQVVFATSEPMITGWRPDLTHILRKDVQCVVANPLDVSRYLMEFYGVTRSVRKAKDQKDGARELGSKIINFEQLLELGKSATLGADDQHIVHIVDWLLQYAFEQRASDIHLEPRREIVQRAFPHRRRAAQGVRTADAGDDRRDGRIKVLGRMDLAERRPQDGRLKTRSPGGREVEMRLSTMPTAFGEKVRDAHLRSGHRGQAFKQLGFRTRRQAAGWNEMVSAPHGIVLVTGPTGSGKTTTLYSTLKRLATPDVNVCTVEDPIEMIAPEFNQMQVQHNIDLGLRRRRAHAAAAGS